MIEECCVRRGSINQVEGTKVGVYKWLMVSRDCVDYNSAQIEMGDSSAFRALIPFKMNTTCCEK